MRVLLTGLPIQSHLLPALVPVAKALQRRGHDVALATGTAVRAQLEGHGIEVLAIEGVPAPEEVSGADQLEDSGTDFSVEKLRRWRPELTGPLVVPVFSERMTAAFAANLIDVARAWRPEVIVRETNEYGGYLAAEVLGLPLAMVDIAPLITRLVPDLTDRLNRLRGKLGLAEVDSFTHANGRLTAGLLPAAWYPEDLRTPGLRHYRAADAVDSRPLDPAIARLPADLPLVLASYGTSTHWLLGAESTLMHLTVEALGSLPVQAVVALGPGDAVARWNGPRPNNVHLTSFVQQRLLIGACDVFLTHGGFGGIGDSLSAGTPMTALPLFADQPDNTARVQELGLGVRTDPAGLTPDTLAADVQRVLTEPAYRLAARGFQRQILGLPSLEAFAADLETLDA
ncbi:glycosyltransferase family 1 protein [Solihabitans fulvus]|uniref:Glycosyltransferase family 1 protein n=1 Tax=Solihabitans fulvus TaxID=1892852 RepID=A0A5B2XHS9_9PSEU|nr:glycosyltransferase [Solihabitans fulvus]KAA2262312.1 glycosyltransferase family 1 protein [Solihabitans fulvus]